MAGRWKWAVIGGIAGLVPIPSLLFSCGGAGSTPSDAGADVDGDASGEAMGFLKDVGPGIDANVAHCTLGDGTDPVALCTQKVVLAALHAHAFDAADPTKGVASSWSPTTGAPDVGDGGVRLHVWTDDVGYAAASALFHTSATLYGDMQLTPTLDADLTALVPILEKELAPLPDEYSGEPYERLRVAAGGLRTITQLAAGNAIDDIANAYGRAIYTTYFHPLAAVTADGGGPADGGMDASGSPDAATDARTTEAGATDARAEGATTDAHEAGSQPSDAQAGDGAALLTDGIFGRPSAAGYAYLSGSAAAAAFAVLDLAARNPTDASQMKWQLAARAAFDHLYLRARDPATGLYFTGLTTTALGAHDALDASVPDPTWLLADTTATVALALTRARDLVAATPGGLAALQSYPFSAHIADALTSLNGKPTLYDGPVTDAGASTGFLEGYDPAAGLVTLKVTEANAFALVVIDRQFFTSGTPWGPEIAPLTRTLTQALPVGSSLFSVIAKQEAFFAASSRGFGLPGGDAGSGPNPGSYQSAASLAFVESMNALLPSQ